MHPHPFVGILTEAALFNLNAFKTVLFNRETSHFLLRHFQANGNGIMRLRVFFDFFETFQIRIADFNVLLDLLNGACDGICFFFFGIQFGQIIGRNLQRKPLGVSRHRYPPTIENRTTLRRDRHHRRAIAFSFDVKGFVANHLQINKTRHQGAETHKNQQLSNHQSSFKQLLL